MNYEIGTQIGDYQILSVLGTGGMGKVYKVRNVISDRVEAMKILLPDLANQQALADRFLREIKVLASLNHPNIAALHTALRVENQLLMIMELVDGVTLGDELQSGHLPLKEALTYMDQALSALSYAHRQRVIHRDIKPANMMLTPQGTLKLMDFGIARAPSDSKLTMTGTTLGSLHYMSPEQVKGGPLDARSDLYSLGVVLYEVVTGKRPFQEASEYSVMAAHLEKAPQPPIELNPSLPQPLNAMILLSLAKDPAQRFQSADAFRTALGSVAGISIPVVPGAAVSSPAATTASPLGMAQAPGPQAPPLQRSPALVPGPQIAKPAGYRGLYMALGALLVVLVIAASAIELPRWMKARAGGKAAKAGSTLGAADSSAAQPQPASANSAASASIAPAASTGSGPGTSSNPAAGSQPPSSTTPLNSASSGPVVSKPAPESGTGAATEATIEATTGGNLAEKRRHTTPRHETVSGQGTQESATGNSGSAGASAQQSAPSSPPTSSGSNAGANTTEDQQGSLILQRLQDRMDLLSSRASAVDQSLKTLQQQQASSGLSMRGDVSASWIRMKGFMDRADAALSAGQPLMAKLNMDRAEREIDFLEKFLGR
mgnify:CR=1 FL=1